MNDNRTGTSSARRMKSVAALLGGAATIALTAISLGHPTDGTLLAGKSHHGSNTEYTSPTQTAMKMGATTVESTDQVATRPPAAPEIAFAAPRVKAG